MMNIKYLFSKLMLKIQIPSIRDSVVDGKAWIGSGCSVWKSSLGRYSYVGNYSRVNYSSIGQFCSIAGNVAIGGGSHPKDWISTSPAFYKKAPFGSCFSEVSISEYEPVTIGNDVWIGCGAIVMGGVTIGNGSIIGAGAVVTKNVGDYEIWAGCPAKKIGDRFSADQKAALLSSEWWCWPDEVLKENSDLFTGPLKDSEELIRVSEAIRER